MIDRTKLPKTECSDLVFGRMLRDHQQAVRQFARRLCAHDDEADDLSQEAFVFAWRRIANKKENVSFKSFVCGFVYRLAANKRRGLFRSMRRNAQWFDLSQTTQSPQLELKMTAKAALQSLSIDQRACIILCLIEDYSHKEAATILGLPLGTIKSHIERGRTRLIALMKEA